MASTIEDGVRVYVNANTADQGCGMRRNGGITYHIDVISSEKWQMIFAMYFLAIVNVTM